MHIAKAFRELEAGRLIRRRARPSLHYALQPLIVPVLMNKGWSLERFVLGVAGFSVIGAPAAFDRESMDAEDWEVVEEVPVLEPQA